MKPASSPSSVAWAGAGFTVGHDRAVGLRLALEAHLLFANASEAQVATMRYDFGRSGAAWAETLRAASQACAAAERDELADDLGRWMAGAVDQLGPHVLVDPEAREVARRCITWHGQRLAATRDEVGARAALDALRLLESIAAEDPV